MTTVFRCFVAGDPRPKGSKTAFSVRTKGGKNKAVMTESSDKTGRLKTWRARLAEGIQHALIEREQSYSEDSKIPLPLGVLRGKELIPVAVCLGFEIARPPSAPKYRLFPTTTPDLDKLERTVLDELSGVVFLDDRQVCELHSAARYSPRPGVLIEVWIL